MSSNPMVPPHDEAAEKAVIGSILLSPESLEDIGSIVTADDFYVYKNQIMFSTLRRMYDEQKAIDVILLSDELRREGKFEKVGGAKSLLHLTDDIPTTAHASHYASLVHRSSALRQLIVTAGRINENSRGKGDHGELTALIESMSEHVQSVMDVYHPKSLFEFGDEFLEGYKQVADGMTGIELPWKTWTKTTSGLWPGTVTIIVARPSVGKTFVSILVGRHAWEQGKRVLFISPEMAIASIAERFYAVHSRVSYSRIVHGTLSTFELPKLEKVISDLEKEKGFWIVGPQDRLTPEALEASIRASRPDLVLVDSVYDLHFPGDRRERIILAMRWMKAMSQRYGCAFMAFSQQNREAEKSAKQGGGSRLGTIALADEVAQDADTIFALEQDRDMKADKRLAIKPLKLRRGYYAKDSIEVCWDFDLMQWDEVEDGEVDSGYSDEEGADLPF